MKMQLKSNMKQVNNLEAIMKTRMKMRKIIFWRKFRKHRSLLKQKKLIIFKLNKKWNTLDKIQRIIQIKLNKIIKILTNRINKIKHKTKKWFKFNKKFGKILKICESWNRFSRLGKKKLIKNNLMIKKIKSKKKTRK
jgi:hypothetical protein